jgi:hypothetical protein
MTKLKALIIARQRLKDARHTTQCKAKEEDKYFQEQIRRVQANIDSEVAKKHALEVKC